MVSVQSDCLYQCCHNIYHRFYYFIFILGRGGGGSLATQSTPSLPNPPLVREWNIYFSFPYLWPLTNWPSRTALFHLAVAHKNRFETWALLIRDHDGFSAFNGVLTVNPSDLFAATACDRARTPDTHKPAEKGPDFLNHAWENCFVINPRN